MSSSGCCGRLEGEFLLSHDDGARAFPERRKQMEAMGPLYRAIRERFGDDVDVQVVDPRNMLTLLVLLAADFRRFGVPLRQALWTLTHIPVQGVVVNGRLVARGSWPEVAPMIRLVEGELAGT